MGKVKVEVYAMLREKLKWSNVDISFNGDSITFKELISKVSDLSKIIVDSNGNLRNGYIILINGIHAQFLGGANAKVKDGDVISIFPPGAGG